MKIKVKTKVITAYTAIMVLDATKQKVAKEAKKRNLTQDEFVNVILDYYLNNEKNA